MLMIVIGLFVVVESRIELLVWCILVGLFVCSVISAGVVDINLLVSGWVMVSVFLVFLMVDFWNWSRRL